MLSKLYIWWYKAIILEILEDALLAFSMEPNVYKENSSGLCPFILHHYQLRDMTIHKRFRLVRYILSDKYSSNTYMFAHGHPQSHVWAKGYLNIYKLDRSVWCRQRIKQIRK